MEKYPSHIKDKLEKDKDYYSLYSMDNIERAKVDEDYLGDIILVNENLIWHSVHKYIGKPETIVANNCVEKDDILQLGRLGFIKSIYAFDTTRGIKFSSFAVTAIVREIRCFLRDSGSIIRPTRTANELMYKIAKIEQDLGYKPSAEELADILGEKLDKVSKALKIGRAVKYLDEPISAGGDGTHGTCSLLDFVEGNKFDIEIDVVDKIYVDSIIDAIRDTLSDKEVSIVKKRISGLNQTQTAKKENVSQMRVSRVIKKVAKILENSRVVE